MGSESRSMTNTDHCTLGWAIIWTCIKTIYKQCNWPGSGGDAGKMDRLTNFWSYQQKEGFINFLEAVIEFFRRVSCYSRPLVQGSSPTVTLHTSSTKNRPLPPTPTCSTCMHTRIAFTLGSWGALEKKCLQKRTEGNSGAERKKIKENTM